MSPLKTLFTCKAIAAISSMGYSGELYGEAWSLLEWKFGGTYLIAETKLKTLRIQ